MPDRDPLKTYNFLIEPATDAVIREHGDLGCMAVEVFNVDSIESALSRLRRKYSRDHWRIIQVTQELPVLE